MPAFLVLDIAGLSLCFVLTGALALVASLAGLRRRLNHAFAAFALTVSGWAACSLLLRMSLWLGLGDPQALLDLSAGFFAVVGPALLAFSAAYAGVRSRLPVAVSLLVVLLMAGLAPFLARGSLVYGPQVRASGMVLYAFTAPGLAVGLVPAGCLLAVLGILLARPEPSGDRTLPAGVALLLAGYLGGGIVQIDAPVMSLLTAGSVSVLGWGIMRRQVFAPLRDLAVDLRERAHRQELIAQIGRRTATLLGLDALLAEAVRLVRESFDWFAVAVFLAEGDDLVLRASSLPAMAPRVGAVRLRIGRDGICGAAAGAGRPVLVPDVARDPRYMTLAAGVPTRSELAVPLVRSGRVIGVLDVQSAREGAFGPEDVATQETIADQLSVAIENARLFEEARRRAERLALVNRISSAVGSVLELERLLPIVYEEVAPIFEADAFFVAMYDAGANELDFRLLVDEGRREPPLREPPGTGLTSRVVQTGEPLLVKDMGVQRPEGVTPEAWGTGKMPTSWIGAPMRIGARVTGVLSVQTYGERRYDEDDLLLAATIADQVALAVENARLYDAARRELSERQKAEEKFRNLAEQSPSMIFINAGGRIVYANRQCEITMGWSREELYSPGFDFRTLTDPAYLDLVEGKYRAHARGEEVPPYEYALRTRAGARVDAIVTTKLIRYEDQRAILGIITDISARARTERLLHSLNATALAMEQALAPEEIFPAAVRALAALGCRCAVFLADAGGELRARCWSGGAPHEVHGPAEGTAPALSLTAWLEAAGAEGREGAFLTSATLMRPVYRMAGIEEEWTTHVPASPSHVVVAPLAVGEERLGMLVVCGADIDAGDVPPFAVFAHQAAAAWRKTRLMGDLEASLAQLRRAQEQLVHAQKMEAVGRLAGGIAHDFNNLLTVISGYASLMSDAVTPNSDAADDLAQIRATIKRASTLTGRLLAFSRRHITQPVTLDLNRVVSSSLSLLRPLIGEDIELVARLAEEPLPVRADHLQVEQVIMNLAVNARDAMPSGGTLTVETAAAAAGLAPDLAPGPWVTLRVRDTGIGMSDDTRAHVFEPFFTTKEEGKGSGLGLSTVYGIVSQSGGRVTVESALGRGSTFTVVLPRAADAGAAEIVEGAGRASPRGSGTVLLVEDEAEVRELARRILERGGYAVVPVPSAREALLVAEGSARLDCVVSDVVMPGGMSGIELGERLARSRPALPVLYVSGYSDEAAVRGVIGGTPARGYLRKPFQPEDLLEQVRALVTGR